MLLALTFHVGQAHSVDKASVISPKKVRGASPTLDSNRYIGLTIFNFETDPRVDDERIEHSARIGCNAVEITINWDQVYASVNSQPKWDVVDSHVHTAQRLGLMIALRVHIGREAYKLGGFWGVHETMQAADSSRSISHGIVQFSYSHQPTIERAGEFVREVASRYRYLQQQKRLLFFSVVSSPALESEYSPVYDPPTSRGKYIVPYDYGYYELEAFRQFLQGRFTLSQLNQRWGTDFSQWSRVRPPANNVNDPYASHTGVRGEDWYVFRHGQLKKFIDRINGIIKGVDNDIVVVNQHGCTWDRLSGLRATYAFRDLAQSADGLKFNDGPDYNHRFSMDVVRSNLKPGAFMINAVDGMFYNTVSTDRYYEQVVQCYEHGAKMITMANFFAQGARWKLEDIIARVNRNGLLKKKVTNVQTAGNPTSYKLSEILKSPNVALERWNQRYYQNGIKPVLIEIDEDLLRNAPPVLNKVPELTQPLTDQTAVVDQPFSYSVGQAFTDPDGQVVSVEASGLPEGIRWNSSTGEFSGVPTRAGATLVTLTARDDKGGTGTGTFRLTITDPAGTNLPPVAPVLADQAGQVGNLLTYTLPLFSDPEGQPLVHSLQGVPAGLSYSAETNILRGTPTTAGVFSLTYAAADPAGLTASVTFQVTVKEATPEPGPVRTGSFEGYLDTYNCEGDIWGWVWDRNLPNTPIPIEILDGTNVVGKISANVYRTDLVAAQKGNGLHGYQFVIPASLKDGKPHTIRVRVERSEFYLQGSPQTLNCPSHTAQSTNPANKPPVAVSIPVQNAYLNTPFTYTIPEFVHEDGKKLIYAVSGGVAGLTYHQPTRTFRGTPNQLGTFTASLIVSNGEGGYTPATVSVIVSATPSNRPPVVNRPIANQTATVGQEFAFTIADNTFTDPDNNLASVRVNGLPEGLSYNQTNRKISGKPVQPGVATVTVTATDALAASVSTSFTLTIEAQPTQEPSTNKPPVVAQPPVDQTALVGQTFTLQIPLETFSDPDGSIASIAVSGLPAGLEYQADTRTISGQLTQPGTTTIVVTATDNEGATVTARFELLVTTPGNQPPQVNNTIPDQTATVGQAFMYAIADNIFTDPDGSIVKVEVTSILPDGLTYSQPVRVISGTPISPVAVAGRGSDEPTTTTVIVKATDNHGDWVTTSFRLTITPGQSPNQNRPPVAARPIPDQTATVGKAFTYTFGPDLFNDPDGYIAKIEVAGLPTGLIFNNSPKSISGILTSVTTATIAVTATDNEGATVTIYFQLTVQPSDSPKPEVVTGEFEGFLDKVECGTIRGWVWDRKKPNTPMTVEFYADGNSIGTTEAGIFRIDLKDAGKGDGRHAYSFVTPAFLKDKKPHVISAKVLNSTYTLMWAPKTLTCSSPSARLSAESAGNGLNVTVLGNPVSDQVVVEVRGAEDRAVQFQITDLKGQLVGERQIEKASLVETQSFQLKTVPTGILILRVSSEGQAATVKLLKH
ncbi:hypothetical protein GCM10027347_12740 [Larkinella harenae]